MKNPFQKNIKVFLVLFVLFVLIYFSYSIISGLTSDKYQTEKIISSVHNDYFPLSGIALRDEELILSDGPSLNIDYKVSDGDRIAKNEIIASCSTVQLSEKTQTQINRLSRRIDTLSSSVGATVFNDIKTMDKNIVKSLQGYLTIAEKNNYSDSLQAVEEVQVAINKKDIKFSGDSYYQAQIEENAAAKKMLFTENAAKETEIVSDMAGYFCSAFDGYEWVKALDYAEPSVASFEKLLQAEPQSLPSGYIGKVQQSPEWKYIALVSSVDAEKFYVGQKVTIEFDFIQSGKQTLPLYVGYISPAADGKAVIVFRCESLNAGMFYLRKNDAKIVQASYTGFKINTSSLHLDDKGRTGVYVLSAHRIVFKQVDILYTAEDFLIVKSVSVSGDFQLNSGDEIITNGKNLYDGKIVNQ